MSVFTPEEREALRAHLITAAQTDHRVMAAAHVGSAATGRVDRWSDIDLALAVAPDADRDELVGVWTGQMYREHGALTHLDVWRGTTLYRVFLLENTLQVDLSFWESAAFGATGPAFRLIFGTASPHPPPHPTDPAELIGLGWLYALHVRSSLERGRVWQADFMLRQMRDQVLALACLRSGVPHHEARGWDDLPPDVTASLEETIAHSLSVTELKRAFAATMAALLVELRQVDGTAAERLTEPLTLLLD